MAPANWLGWTSDLSDLVRIPVTPLSHVGVMVASWVRPSVEISDLPSDEALRNELAVAERDQYRQLFNAQMLRATELADRLRELQSLPESALLNPLPPIILPVDITGRRPNNPSADLELKLTRGMVGRALQGDIAVVGTDVVGKISRVGLSRIVLQPITHRDTGLTRAAIVPSNSDNTRPPLIAEVILQSRGEAFMIAEAKATSGVQKGDLVIVDDSSWSKASKGFILGVIDQVVQLDEAPLRQRLIVLPRKKAQNVSRVVILGTGEGERK